MNASRERGLTCLCQEFISYGHYDISILDTNMRLQTLEVNARYLTCL